MPTQSLWLQRLRRGLVGTAGRAETAILTNLELRRGPVPKVKWQGVKKSKFFDMPLALS